MNLASFLLITQLVTSFTYRMDTIDSKTKPVFNKWAVTMTESIPLLRRCAVYEVLKNAFDAELGKRLDDKGLIELWISDGKVVVRDTGVMVSTKEKLADVMRYFGGAGIGLLQAEIMSDRLIMKRTEAYTEVTLMFDNYEMAA